MVLKANGSTLEWNGVDYAIQDRRGNLERVDSMEEAETWLAAIQFQGDIMWRTRYVTGWSEAVSLGAWEAELNDERQERLF